MNYLLLIIKHKWFVFLAGKMTGCSLWRRIIHDWTKFLPCELPHYQRQFFGRANDPEGFMRCWAHHQNSNDHHWEYWIPRTGHNRCKPPFPDNESLVMPMAAIKEMVADWMGASRVYSGEWPEKDNWPWFEDNWLKIKKRLHINTINRIEKLLFNMEYDRILEKTK